MRWESDIVDFRLRPGPAFFCCLILLELTLDIGSSFEVVLVSRMTTSLLLSEKFIS